MSAAKCVILIIFSIQLKKVSSDQTYNTSLGEQLELKFMEYVDNFTKYLEGFNDENLGSSEIGKFLKYEDMKPKVEGGRAGKSIKKMSTAMLPLIFHVGATSTWMLLTSIMAAKSVAIGLILLVFKIAVSSAKVASFFTALKAKHGSPHHDWSWSPPPEYGHDRSLQKTGQHPPEDWQAYSPEWTPNEASPPEYKTIPVYKNVEHDATLYSSVASTKNDKKYSRK